MSLVKEVQIECEDEEDRSNLVVEQLDHDVLYGITINAGEKRGIYNPDFGTALNVYYETENASGKGIETIEWNKYPSADIIDLNPEVDEFYLNNETKKDVGVTLLGYSGLEFELRGGSLDLFVPYKDKNLVTFY